jgi:hypothetical protein
MAEKTIPEEVQEFLRFARRKKLWITAFERQAVAKMARDSGFDVAADWISDSANRRAFAEAIL